MILALNRKARFDYHILETFQAGLALTGSQVKSVRAKKINIGVCYVVYQNDRLEIINFGEGEEKTNVPLLLGKREQNQIIGAIAEKGVSCIVLNLKTVRRWLKADIALAKGKKKWDKRETIKKRDLDREARKGQI